MLTVTAASEHGTRDTQPSSGARPAGCRILTAEELRDEYARTRLVYRLHLHDQDVLGAMPYLANMARILRLRHWIATNRAGAAV